METNKNSHNNQSKDSESKQKDFNGQEESKKEDINNEESKKEKDFWEDTRENVTQGAKLFGETLTGYSEKFMSTIKETATEVYKFSSEFTVEAVNNAQKIIDEYRDKYEVKNLNEKRDVLTTELGLHLYHSIKGNNNEIPDNYLKKKKVVFLLKEIEKIDKMILELIDKEEK